jgi:hypothetical protein
MHPNIRKLKCLICKNYDPEQNRVYREGFALYISNLNFKRLINLVDSIKLIDKTRLPGICSFKPMKP